MSTTRSEIRTNATINALAKMLASHHGDEKAIWKALPTVFVEVTGRPLDRSDPHDIMVGQSVVKKLS